MSSRLSIMRMSSSTARVLTATTAIAIATAVILLASNFTITNAQTQSLTSQQPSAIENGTTTAAPTTFQSTNDSFSIQVPQGWVIQDLNNTGSALLNESSQGYGMLAQLCPEEEQQQGTPLTNASGGTTNSRTSSTTSSCQGSEQVIYIIRYPDLDTRIRAASNVTTTTTSNNNITTDDVLSYHLQKLQEVGYRSPQILNSTEVRLNLTNPQTNETIATVPARLVEMAYSTSSAPNETRIGYFISTATTSTPPNLGTTKGYAVFYEGNSTTNNSTAAEITTTVASGSLAPTPLPAPVGQAFDSFELIAAPEVAQASADEAQPAQTAESDDDEADNNGDDDGGDTSCHPSYPDVCIPPPPPNLNCDDVEETNFEVVGSDPHGFDGDNDGIGCENGDGDGGDDDGNDDDGSNDNGDDDGSNDNGDDGDEGEGNTEGDDPNEFEGCTVVGNGRDVGDVGC